MVNKVCEKCIHRSVCALHEDDFMSSAEKNGFCSQCSPSDDYVKIKRGHWVDHHFQTHIPVEYDAEDNLILHDCVINKCSVCGRVEKRKEPYCNCGAKMDNGELREAYENI